MNSKQLNAKHTNEKKSFQTNTKPKNDYKAL